VCWTKVCIKLCRMLALQEQDLTPLVKQVFSLPESGSWGQAPVSTPCCWASGPQLAVAESRHQWPALWRPEIDDLASADVDEHWPFHPTCTQFTWLIPRGSSCILGICSEMGCAVVNGGVLLMCWACDRLTFGVVKCVRQSCEWER